MQINQCSWVVVGKDSLVRAIFADALDAAEYVAHHGETESGLIIRAGARSFLGLTAEATVNAPQPHLKIFNGAESATEVTHSAAMPGAKK